MKNNSDTWGRRGSLAAFVEALCTGVTNTAVALHRASNPTPPKCQTHN